LGPKDQKEISGNLGGQKLVFPQKSVEKMLIKFRMNLINSQNLRVFSDLPIFAAIK
jgi:hypothetical protein